MIDIHTHIFPDEIAAKAVEKLRLGVEEADCGYKGIVYSDGTAADLLRVMDRAGVERSVLLPVATRPSQPESINRWTMSLDNDRLIPFGAFYPERGKNQTKELEYLAENDFRGIKLHGDYQDFYADDEHMIPVYKKCAELGLAVVLHAGFDFVSPDDIHVTPERMLRAADKAPDTIFVLAHMGGIRFEEQAAELLSDNDHIYVDTSYTAGRLSPDVMHDLIMSYGADRVLFGSDCPWNDPADVIALIRNSRLSEEDFKKILRTNAENLFLK